MPGSLLCETVTAPSMAELVAARDAATAGDMVELRLDGVRDLDVARALHGCRVPVLATCRPEWEGGRFDGSEDERHDVLVRAVEQGADFVDIEWRTLHGIHQPNFIDVVRRAPERIVLSSHDFDGVPIDLERRVRDMRSSGAGLVKVAVTARRLSDTLPLKGVAREGNAVVVGMGDSGLPSRLLAAIYGSRWTYAGNAVAPGQIPASRMVQEFRFRSVGPGTRLFGVVSSNAMHSLSPAMHNAAFAAAGIDAVYVPLQAADFGDFLEFASAMNVDGVSVTIPFKRDALRAAARVDALARQVGAANTLRRVGPPAAFAPRASAPGEGGPHTPPEGTRFSWPMEWEATNTDVAGFLEPLEAAIGSLQGMRAAVLGGGGAARAVVVALLSRGAHVTVHARREEQAQEVTAALGAGIGAWPAAPGSWDLLVNCTPLGGPTGRSETPLGGGPFTGRVVYDLTYGPGESTLVREARTAGCVVLDGLPMLVAQAERQFEWWTGQSPAPGVMGDAVRRRLATETLAGAEAPAQRAPQGTLW